MRQIEIKKETTVIKEPVTGDKRCAIDVCGALWRFAFCITCISLLVARARQLVLTLDLFH